MKKLKLLDVMPDFIVEALKTGKAECCDEDEEGTSFPSYCDDCKRYHLTRYYIGYRTEGGKLFVMVHSCDEDGNREFEEEAEADSSECDNLIAEYSYGKGHSKAWKEYYEHCIETGTDDLDEFFVVKEKESPFWIRLSNSILGPKLTAWRRQGEEWKFDNYPSEVIEFADAEVTEKGQYVLKDVTWKDLKLDERARKVMGNLIFKSTMKTPLPESTIAKEVRKFAKRALKSLKL